jgi:NLR family CARD domain-containing protein 3
VVARDDCFQTWRGSQTEAVARLCPKKEFNLTIPDMFQRNKEWTAKLIQWCLAPPFERPVRRYILGNEVVLRLSQENIGVEAKQIGKELATNSTLEGLDLRENRIGNDGADALGDALSVNKSLKRLWLHGNRIGDVGMEALGQALTRNDSLESLDVSHNDFGIVGLTSLANALKSNKKLRGLSLSGNSIDDQGAEILAGVLVVNTSLTSLHLRRNSIEDAGATSILNALAGCNTTLARLYLEENNNISETIRSAVYAFVDANGAGTRLLHAEARLDLSSKQIGDARAKQIATELAGNTTATMLVLNKNEIGDEGSAAIAKALIQNRVLTSIELNNNSLGDECCSAIATMLRENTVLKNILLNGNRIGPVRASALAKTLRINDTLRELGLGQNAIGNEGAAAIAGALRRNGALKRLDLSGNRISDEGVMAVLKALTESNCSLMWLNLEDNADSSPGLKKDIDFVLKSRQVLKAFCKCLRKPLEKGLVPLVIRGVQVNSICHENPELVHSQETMAGPVFLLVREAALVDSKVTKATAPSRRGATNHVKVADKV